MVEDKKLNENYNEHFALRNRVYLKINNYRLMSNEIALACYDLMQR